MHRRWIVVLFVAAAGLVLAAQPPGIVNYQGVLRDATNVPREGPHDVVFRLYNALSAGAEILVDAHTAAYGFAVTVEGGLFSTQVGSGRVTDGSGAGTYTSLADVFRDYGTVYLAVEINGEVLTPRVRLASAPYAHNAANLGGRAATGFVDTTPTAQTKAGALTLDASLLDLYGVTGMGRSGGGYFKDADNSAEGFAASGNRGLLGYGTAGGGYFADTDSSGVAYTADGDYGVRAWGNIAGGYFRDADQSGYSMVGRNDNGIEAFGNTAGAYFKDLDGSGYAYVGYADRGIDARGNAGGGYFADLDSSAFAYVGSGDRGIEARGNTAGAFLADRDGSGYAYVGHGDRGIDSYGNSAGGMFVDIDSGSYGYVGRGVAGIEGYGADYGGYFVDSSAPEHAFAYAGYTDAVGIKYGVYAGGYNGGVEAHSTGGGAFGRLGWDTLGVWAEGSLKGAYFADTDSAAWVNVATGSYKIYGSGTVNFVQNHPVAKDRVIVYTAPEGDEAATYTRGSARLSGGIAHVALGETFRFVTNPDIGLTAYLTPRGRWADLYVVSLTPGNLVVASGDGSQDAVFDYLVFGLRIGFEEASVVQDKEQEAYIPAMTMHRDLYARFPELRRFNALERFTTMRAAIGETGAVDRSASRALHDAIGEYDLAVHGQLKPAASMTAAAALADGARTAIPCPEAQAAPSRDAARGAESEAAAVVPGVTTLPVSEPVDAGDLLAFDPLRPGALRRAASVADPLVAGVAVGPSETTADGQFAAPVSGAGFAMVKVDASYGPIRTGDLLTSSPTTGHAMLALEPPAGAVLGKAAGALESGTGTILVLLMAR